jgi:ADP-ribose pyrophosphatase
VMKDQGSYKKNEIEIILNPSEITSIEDIHYKRLRRNGQSHDKAFQSSRAGIISEDSYWILIRDPVIFPSGAKGLYNRVLWKSSLDGFAGVSILPILPDNRVLLILNYRHATRQWELELPKGGRLRGENEEEAAQRELLEETGSKTEQLHLLGSVNVDAGLTNTEVPVYLIKTGEITQINQDYSEAIRGTHAFTIKELKQGLAQGYIELKSNGKSKKYSLKDSLLSYALLIAEQRKLL